MSLITRWFVNRTAVLGPTLRAAAARPGCVRLVSGVRLACPVPVPATRPARFYRLFKP